MTGWLSAADWDALGLSLRVALLSVVLSLPIALALAWLCRASVSSAARSSKRCCFCR